MSFPAFAKVFCVAAVTLLLTGCPPNVPEFDYTLKSAGVIETNNEFGLELLNRIISSEEQPNLMISPASMSMVLCMAYNGAESTTRDAFEMVMEYGDLTRDEINEIMRELIEVLEIQTKRNHVELANSAWYPGYLQVNQEFIGRIEHHYDAQVQELDFSSPGAVGTINDWCSDHTDGQIDHIIDLIDEDVVMVLLNALYFNCFWEYEFDPEDTREVPFYTEDDQLFGEVEMMSVESDFRSLYADEFQAVELPYRDHHFSMYIFLPHENTTVAQLVEQLDGEIWNDWLSEFTENEEMEVTMPKFKFEYERSVKEDLVEMGLGPAFSGEADFSGIGAGDIFLSDVIQKTCIDVNEKGTSAMSISWISLGMGATPPMLVDRPFLFMIVENSSKSILFAGRVSEPTY